MIRWGIIGCGDVTERKSGPAFQEVPGSALEMVMRRSADKCADYAKRHGVPRWTTDADELIHDPRVDAVYVATPPSSHADYALRVIEAGKPVYVEKPMCARLEDSERLAAAARRPGARVYVAYYRRRLPYFLKIKELVDGGAIGRVRYARVLHTQAPSEDAAWLTDKDISGGGLIYDVGCHTLDILDYILGPIASVRSFHTNQMEFHPVEDTTAASFAFESGAIGNALWCFDARESREQNEIEGTEGVIRFTTFSNEPIILENAAGVERFAFISPAHIQSPLIAQVTNCILGKEVPVSTAETALRTDRILAKISRQGTYRS